MRWLMLIGAAVAALLVVRPAGASDPLACDGYAEKRVYLEAQSWWSPTEKDADAEHIHVSTCWPWSGYGSTLTGKMPLDLRFQLHHAPTARSDHFRVQDWSHTVFEQPLALGPCEQCEATVHVNLDTSLYCNGRREARISLIAFDNGKQWFNSTGWQFRTSNPSTPTCVGPSRSEGTDNWTEARGWYETGATYMNARFRSALPDGPKSGLWSFRWETAGNARASGYAVYVDPAFHATPPSKGLVVVERLGGFRGTTTLDTTMLSNGWHRLVLRADSLDGIGRTSGLQVIGFEVSN